MGLFPLWYPGGCPQPDGESTLLLLEPVQARFLQAVMDPQARDWGSSYPETRSLQNLTVDEYVALRNAPLD